MSCLLLLLGLTHLVLLTPARKKLATMLGAAAIATGAILAGTGLVVTSVGAPPRSLPYFLDLTVLGTTTRLFRDYSEEFPVLPSRELTAADIPRFMERSGLPDLPAGSAGKQWNVLLITVESLRYDNTSLANPALRTTPNLVRLRDSGATSFSRAYSAASGTVLSMASVHTMTYPSLSRVNLWRKSWHGNLPDEVTTAATEFRAAGFHTFWYSHDHRFAFSRCMLNFDRGFDDVSYVYAIESSVETDSLIADNVVTKLASVRDRRFFGWVFFASPHGEYVVHYGDMPGKQAIQRYRQEIRYADEQIGRVLDALETNGLLDETIIIVTGDHGEEFREHGGTKHKSTVYVEVTHVPLLIRVPGGTAGPGDKPTSLTYLFPWLLTQLDLGTAGSERILRDLLPMMNATEDAVIIELFGNRSTRSSLVIGDHKVNYDFRSRRHELFDLAADPREQKNLINDARASDRYIGAMRRYRAFRAQRNNTTVDRSRDCDNTDR